MESAQTQIGTILDDVAINTLPQSGTKQYYRNTQESQEGIDTDEQ
jgi:hypothetical protein